MVVDAAQLAPHRPLPADADFLAFSGHKLYAPFGAGALIGPRAAFDTDAPFLAGGGAVELVELDAVVWAPPPEREEAGSPNVLGAVGLGAAIDELAAVGWPAIADHERALARRLQDGLAGIEGVRVLGAGPDVERLPVVSFVVEGVPHVLVAARLSAEFAIGVRDGCFCAHPYLTLLLRLTAQQHERARAAACRHDRGALPGAVRASAGISTTGGDVSRPSRSWPRRRSRPSASATRSPATPGPPVSPGRRSDQAGVRRARLVRETATRWSSANDASMPSVSVARSGVRVRSAPRPNTRAPAYDTTAIPTECSANSGT